MSVTITKSEAIAAYDGNASDLARALKITPQAIYQWADGPIPQAQALKLRYVLRPGLFGRQQKRQRLVTEAGQ